MQRICILALLGLPAAGKTSFSRWLLASTLPFNIVHLCYDDYYTPPPAAAEAKEIPADFDFKLQRSEILKLLASIVRSIRETSAVRSDIRHKLHTTSRDFLIICDDNNYYRSMRYQLLQLCRVERLAYAQIYFETSLADALTRNAKRAATSSNTVPQNIIEKMYAKLEAPEPQQHAWETTTLMLNANCASDASYCSEKIAAFISAAFENVQEPPTPLLQLVKADSASLVDTAASAHLLDVQLRRRIGELLLLGTYTAATKQARANFLNARRKEILRDFKGAQVMNRRQLDANDLSQYVELLE